MEKHTVNSKDLLDFKNKEKVLFARSIGEEGVKELYCTLHGNYEVWKDGELVAETNQNFWAVKTYNKI